MVKVPHSYAQQFDIKQLFLDAIEELFDEVEAILKENGIDKNEFIDHSKAGELYNQFAIESGIYRRSDDFQPLRKAKEIVQNKKLFVQICAFLKGRLSERRYILACAKLKDKFESIDLNMDELIKLHILKLESRLKKAK